MNFEAGLSRAYLELVYICTIYLNNRSLSRKKDITLWETWYNKYLNAKLYRIFWCQAYV